ncbi:MAG: superoxide dismutase [Bacillota bacterium]|nr:superoxide dismutase [Bacillota bacterium]
MSSLFKTYPYELEALEYDFNALEPYIDAKTVEIHHDRHQRNYVNSLNAVIEENPEYKDWTLDDFFRKEMQIPSDIRHIILRNAGGVYNHEEYFSHMTPDGQLSPEGELADAVEDFFGSVENLKAELKKAALDVFGSGYAYLVVTPQSWLQIITLSNQETPVQFNFKPLLIVDVWEHAYYLGYQNKRADYFDNWWNTVDWKKAEETYEEVNAKNKKFEFGF